MIPVRAIFISYRRDDSEGQAGRLYDDLARQFGDGSVFMDVAAIGPGLDFRKVIDKNVASCGVLLAVIGPSWLDAKDETGQRRLDNAMDFVRLETAAALKRDIPVVPVLVRGARMPRSEQLPDDLKELAYRNGFELTHARWDSDVEVLVKALTRQEGAEKGQAVEVKVESPPVVAAETRKGPSPRLTSVPEEPSKSRRMIVGIAGAIIFAIMVGIVFYLLRNPSNKDTSNPRPPVAVQPVIKVFAATPTQVTKGGKVTIRWEVANADDVELAPFGQVPSSGNSIDEPQQTTIYKLSATNKDGGKTGTFQEVIVNEAKQGTAEDRAAVVPSPGTNELPFEGTWLNDDVKTGSITKLIITQSSSGVSVHAFGACHPKDCDWGTQQGFVDNLTASVTWDQGFVMRTMKLTLNSPGHLGSTLDSVYSDHRPRQQLQASFHK